MYGTIANYQYQRRTTGWELPHHIPYEAKERLLGQSMEHWPSAARACFELLAKDLKGCVLKELEKHFGRFPALEQHARYVESLTLFRCEGYLMTCAHDSIQSIGAIASRAAYTAVSRSAKESRRARVCPVWNTERRLLRDHAQPMAGAIQRSQECQDKWSCASLLARSRLPTYSPWCVALTVVMTWMGY